MYLFIQGKGLKSALRKPARLIDDDG